MGWLMTSGLRSALTRTAVAAAVAGAAVMGFTVLADVTSAEPMPLRTVAVQDPGCDMFGWRHPMCAGGAFGPPADDGIPGDNAAEGGIPAPAMVPNIDGSLSPPGTPGAI